MVECSIPQKRMRAFSKLIGCFSRIAEEVHLEVSDAGFHFRAVSLALSGYVGAQLSPRFFDEWVLDKRIANCKIALKHCHAILKSVNNVERCIFRLDEKENRVVFIFHCRLGLKKVFKLTYDDTAAAMHATYKKAEAVNYLSIKNKILSDALQNITPSTEEIGLLPANNRIKIRTHVEPGSALSKMLLSEVILVDKDFDSYRIADNSQELIFPMKELRAVLRLAEALGHPISIHFDSESGVPIVFSLECQHQLHMTIDVVLATQVDTHMAMSPAGTPNKGPTSPSPHPSPGHAGGGNSQSESNSRPGLSGISPVQTIPGIPSKRPGSVMSDSDPRSGVDTDASPKKARASPPECAPQPQTHPTPKTGSTTTAPTAPPPSVPKRVLWIPNVNDDEEESGGGGGGGGGGDPMVD